MEKLRVITVPLNEEAIFDLSYYGIKQYYNNPKDRFEIWNVSESEFDFLNTSGLFSDINNMCKTFIKDDEVVWIDVKNITLVLTVLDEIKQKRNELDKLRCLLKLALDKKTGLEFNFARF